MLTFFCKNVKFCWGYNKLCFIILPIIGMTNLNTLSWINSVERKGMDQGKVPYINEEQFRLLYSPKPTEAWKTIDLKFSKRKEAEKERLQLKIDKHNLVEQYNNLNKELKKVMSQPATTPEEQKSKESRIKAIREEQKNIIKKIKEKNKEIKKKEEEIEKLNKDIYELSEKIREEEHKENIKNKESLDKLNQEKIKDLKSQL